MKKSLFILHMLVAVLLIVGFALAGGPATAESAPEAYWGTSADSLTESGSFDEAMSVFQFENSRDILRAANEWLGGQA